jgi:DNA-binding response OmpR family regulator
MKRILFLHDNNAQDQKILALNPEQWEIGIVSELEMQERSIFSNPWDIIIYKSPHPSLNLISSLLAHHSSKPIIVSTSSNEQQLRVELFKSGISDIINDDISEEEFILRIELIANRMDHTKQQDSKIHIGKYIFDYERRTLSIDNETRILTTKESELLKLLEQSRNKPIMKQMVLREVWGDDSYHNGRSMDVYIGKLRKYLRADDDIHIINIHGMGYKLSILGRN